MKNYRRRPQKTWRDHFGKGLARAIAAPWHDPKRFRPKAVAVKKHGKKGRK